MDPSSHSSDLSTQTSPSLLRIARWCAYASGVVGAAGVVLLVAFYAAYLTTGKGFGLGEMNDATIVVQYALMIPIALAIRELLRHHAPKASLVSLTIGVAGMVAVIVLQLLLLGGVIPFRRQFWMVCAALLAVAAWFFINGRLGRSSSRLPQGMALQLLGALYLGYPFWAFAFARRLR